MEYTKTIAGPDGGETVPMTPEEIAEFQAWQEAEANRPPTPAELSAQIKQLVAAMDPAVLINYAGEAGLIGQFLNESNLTGAVGLLLALAGKINASDDDAAKAALAPIVQLLTDAGVIQ